MVPRRRSSRLFAIFRQPTPPSDGSEPKSKYKSKSKSKSKPTLRTGKYGTISGIPVGRKWRSRRECHKAGMHIKTVAGISGTAEGGAYSIVISGGYEDDDDEGDYLIYTGTGGRRDSYGGSTEQIFDQDWEHRDNRALMTSFEKGKAVRVIRGPNTYSPWAPASGYRYDGLYKATKVYQDIGEHGFVVCKVKFQRLAGQPPIPRRWD